MFVSTAYRIFNQMKIPDMYEQLYANIIKYSPGSLLINQKIIILHNFQTMIKNNGKRIKIKTIKKEFFLDKNHKIFQTTHFNHTMVKNSNLSKKFHVSYDVTSLFTNIPLQETIDIAINLIFNHNPNLNTTRKELFLFLTVSFIIKLME